MYFQMQKKNNLGLNQYKVPHTQSGPTHGGFGEWQDISGGCSATCGGGTKTEERLCDTPAPANGGLNCTGDFTRVLECNNQSCPREYEKGTLSTEKCYTKNVFLNVKKGAHNFF